MLLAKISFKILDELVNKAGDEGKEIGRELFLEAGHVCAFNTFGGIMESAEWYGLIMPMIKNKEDREDLAQEVYLKAYDKLRGFKFNSKLSTWIGTITYNTCLNFLEKKKMFQIYF